MMPGLRVFITSIIYCLLGIESGMYIMITFAFGWFWMYCQTFFLQSSLNLLDSYETNWIKAYGTLYILCTLSSGSRNFFSDITSETNLEVISFFCGQYICISLAKKSYITSLLGIFFISSSEDISSYLLLFWGFGKKQFYLWLDWDLGCCCYCYLGCCCSPSISMATDPGCTASFSSSCSGYFCSSAGYWCCGCGYCCCYCCYCSCCWRCLAWILTDLWDCRLGCSSTTSILC